MESVQTRENVEFPVKHSCVADVAALARINRNVLVPLATLLVSQLFSIVGILLNLSSQACYFLFIIFKTVAQVLFHLFNFCLLWECFKQIFDLES